jgi:cytochrome c oxidase assembly protein subunit 15
LTLCLVVWTARTEPRRGVRRLAWTCLAAVVLQGLLGGLTVIYLLPLGVSVTHACLAQTFLCLVIALAYATSREWMSMPALARSDEAGLRRAAPLLAGVVYAQLVLGALMRHMGAGLAIPDFPLAFGRLLPPLTDAAVAVHFAHRLGAVVVLAATLHCLARAWPLQDRRFFRGSLAILALVLAQISLGALTVLSRRAVIPATLHVTLGAASLGASWLLTLRVYRVLGGDRRDFAVSASLGEPAAAS